MTSTSISGAVPEPSPDGAGSALAGADASLVTLLFETEAAGVALVDRELRYVRVNDALATMNGWPAAAHVGRSIHEVLPRTAAQALEPLLRRVIETGEPVVDLAFVADVPGRGSRHFLASYGPSRDATGAVTGVAAFVAERTPAEVALRESESRLRRVAESGIVGLFFWSMDGGISEANDAFLSMLGYTQADLAAGRVDWRRMTPPEYAETDEAAIRELLATGRHGQVVKEYYARDGRRVPVVVTSAMLDGSTERGVCVCLDDRGRRAAEERLTRVLMQTPAAVAVLLGPDHVVHSANEMFMRLLGRRDYVGRPAREGAPELVEQGFLALMDEVYRTSVPYEGREAALLWDRDGDGTLVEGFFDFVYQPIVDAVGAVEGILVFAVEVTAQVRARRVTEEAVSRTARLQTLTATLAGTRTLDEVAAVVVAEIVAATGAATGMLALRPPGAEDAVMVRQSGLDPDLTKRFPRFTTSTPGPAARCLRTGAPQWVETREQLLAQFPEAADDWERLGTQALATVPLTVAGETVGVMSFTFTEPRSLPAEDRAFFLALGRQAAQAIERARLFEAERDARERVTTVLESINDAFYAVDAEFHFTYVNRKAEELWGRSREELLGRHFWTEFRGALGSESYRMHQRVMTERRAAQFETISPILGRWIDVSIYPEAGGGLSCYFRDISERKEAEAERERLLAAERAAREDAESARAAAETANRAKSEFLAVMSHELRTPLNAIGGYAELMEMGLRGPVTQQQAEDLRRIQSSQRHLLGLINEVLNYAKLETGTVHFDLREVRVCDALAESAGLVAPQARAKGLALTVADCDSHLAVRADGEKLRQILVNLLSNAVKFTDVGGRIDVSSSVAPVASGASSAGDGAASTPAAIIRVRDTGIGIAADQLDRIFEPFVQVRADLTRTAEGTGLGLAISRDLARGMGGELVAESTPGVGSVFTLTLPSA